MKDQISIKFLWGVEDREKWVSLTGSSILTTVDLWTSKVKVLTDIGMFQWWRKDDEYNKLIDERALKADYVIITHGHMDHIGRLALLVKKWFKWKIIMTSLTKDLIPIMLEDYVTITRNNIEEQEEMKKRRGAQFKDFLKAIKLDEELKNNKDLKKADKTAKLKTLNWLKWSFSSIEEFVKYAKLELAKKDILKESDIAQAIETQEIELLYDEDDIKKTMSMIETLEFWDEMDLDNRMIISSLDDENIDKIPELIKWGYDKKIYILPVLKQPIIGKWRKKLDNNKTLTKEIKEDEETLDNLSRELETALEFITFQNWLKSREQKVDIKEENVISTDSLELLQSQKSELEILIDDEWKSFNTQELTTFINENLSFLNTKEDFIIESNKFLDLIWSLKTKLKKIKPNVEKSELEKKVTFNSLVDSNKVQFVDDLENNIDFILYLNNLYEKNKSPTKNTYNKSKNLLLKHNISTLEDIINLDKGCIYQESLLEAYFVFYTYTKDEKLLDFYKNNEDKIKFILKKWLIEVKNKWKALSNLNKRIDTITLDGIPQDNSEQIAFEKYSSLLSEYNISDEKSLLAFIQAEKDKIEIKRNSFITKEDIKISSAFLEPVFKNPNQKVIESFKLRFFEAGHIAWSTQAQVTIVTKQVEHTLNKVNHNPTFKRSFNNILYSGDLWKITQPNLSGSPFASPHKIDIWIFESTYAGREHPDKYIEFDNFVDELNSTVWKNLILTFSLDREQEVEFMLLKNKEDNMDKFPQFKAFRESIKPLKQRLRSLSKIENPTEKEIKDKIDLAEAVSIMNAKIAESQKWIYTGNIIVDAPLAIKIKKVYLKHMPEKYYLLDTDIQTEIFTQEITRTLQKWEYKDLYTAERIRAKDTIIAWGWMAQWWSGLNHIKELLEDPNSKIFFVWYQAEWTLWNKLISWEKQVIIDDKVYNVRCKVVQVWWFSAHPSHSDTVKYITKDLTFAKSAKVILTHWWENRKILASDIEKEISWKVQVLISGLWDEITSKL